MSTSELKAEIEKRLLFQQEDLEVPLHVQSIFPAPQVSTQARSRVSCRLCASTPVAGSQTEVGHRLSW